MWWKQFHDANGIPVFDVNQEYTIDEAVGIITDMEERAPTRIMSALEVHMKMNLDPRFPDQQIRTSVALPHGNGKTVRVAVFCTRDEEEEVKAAGAFVCGEALEELLAKEQFDFDVLIAKPQAMPKLAKLGRILGPKRLMPSPKSGTVITDYAKGIEEFQKGRIELRTDKYSMLHCSAGKVTFGRQKLVDNIKGLLTGLADQKPDGAKKEFWSTVYICASKSAAIKIKPSEFPMIKVNR